MNKPAERPYELTVLRTDFLSQLRFLSVWMGKAARTVRLGWADSSLVIEAGESMVRISAKGKWPAMVLADVSWVRTLAKKMPTGDPLALRVHDGRLYVNRYSVPCAFDLEGLPAVPGPAEPDEKRLLQNAAEVLKPLLLTTSDVEKMIAEARERGISTWQHHDKKMIEIVARAWKFLAPLGVETADIRRVVDDAVRNGWHRQSNKKLK